jgi:hypothetical protein
MSLIADLRDRYSTISPSFNGAQVMRALDQAKPSKRIDSMDICALACRVCGIAQPDLIATAVTNLLASSSALREVMVIGNVKGKKSPRTLPKDFRAIVPLPTLLELGDYLVAKHLNGFIDQLFESVWSLCRSDSWHPVCRNNHEHAASHRKRSGPEVAGCYR